MEDTIEEENGREAKLKAEITRWLVFFGVAIMLSVMTWLGWSLTNRKNPITSFTTLVSDSSVSIGIQGSAPESLDIRSEQGITIEQALLENVYETLVSRSETNKLQPSIAKSWQISDDGLTYTFTLNTNMTFANGHKLDSSDVVWSLQNVINNNYVGADQLGDLKEITNPDENTIVIALNQPNPRLLRALSGRAGHRSMTRKARRITVKRPWDRARSPWRACRNRRSCCNATTRIGAPKPQHRK